VANDRDSKIQKYSRSGVLVDTNLLLVYLVGLYDITQGHQLVNNFKRTKGKYKSGDFDVLDAFLKNFHVRTTTPHLLTEVCNILDNELNYTARDICLGLIQKVIVDAFHEHYIPAKQLLAEDKVLTYGVADMGIMRSAVAGPYLVLTDDDPLSIYLNKVGVATLSLPEIKYA
jgi:rRNA-processing protein FCF1